MVGKGDLQMRSMDLPEYKFKQKNRGDAGDMLNSRVENG